MKVLVNTKDMPRDEWLKWRLKGIGGSDVSVIAGKNPFRSVYQLWMEKVGLVIPQEEENDYTHFGTILESVVRREFMERTGIKVRARHALFQSEEYPFMMANLDGIIYEDGQLVIFEAKTASAYKEDVWEKGVPEEYLLQIQHYMAVTGAKKTYIAALVGGNHFYYHEVLRDENLIADIIQMEYHFWNDNVLAGVEPEADGSKATADYLGNRYPEAFTQEPVLLPDECLGLCEEYDRVKDEIDRLNQQQTEISNRMKRMLGTHAVGIVGSRRVTWQNYSRTSFDQKKLKEDDMKLFKKYQKTSTYRRFMVA